MVCRYVKCPKCKKGNLIQHNASRKKGGRSYSSLKCSRCSNELVSTDQVMKLAQQKTKELQNQAIVKIAKMSHSIGIRIPKRIADRAGFKVGRMAVIKKAKQGINVIPQK